MEFDLLNPITIIGYVLLAVGAIMFILTHFVKPQYLGAHDTINMLAQWAGYIGLIAGTGVTVYGMFFRPKQPTF